MKVDYERNFSKLPLTGKLTKRPWNGNYWPTYRGGITYRWNQPRPVDMVEDSHPRYHYDLLKPEELEIADTKVLSPAEKYDIFMGKEDFPLTSFEKRRTNISKTNPLSEDYDEEFDIPTWEGLCHAWAPAALLYKEPGAVTMEGPTGKKVKFGASDVKALLIYFLQVNRRPEQTKTKFLGTRCYLDFEKHKEKLDEGEITQEEFDAAINESNCTDSNAGAFHMVLSNQIALMDEGFIADVFRFSEVWNYPVYWYESNVIEEKEGASEGAAEGTVKEVRIVTLIKHAYSLNQSWYPLGQDTEWRSYFDNVYGKKKYEYTIELDDKGNIIGGAWISDDRPDFVWKQKLPDFRGFFAPLKEIYEKSLITQKNIDKFWKAIEDGDLELIKTLIENIDIDIQNGEGDTPLHLGVKKKNLELVNFFIKEGVDLNTQNVVGHTPLHISAGLGTFELTKALVEAGAKVDLRDLSGQSPFHFATWNQHFEIVNYLLEKGADINASDSNGKTSLHWATLLGNIKIADFLIEKKANLDVADHSGKTPFYWAVLKNHYHIALSLVNAGVKLDTKDDKGMAPIHIATYKGFKNMLILILDNKADINLTESSGKTPLHMATLEGDLETVKLLLERNADKKVIDKDGKTALDYATGNPEIEALLKVSEAA